MGRNRETYWYALKVFYHNMERVQKDFRQERYETFFPTTLEKKVSKGVEAYVEMPVIPSLLFVKCTAKALKAYKQDHQSSFMFYPEPGTNNPGKIDDAEMENFKKALSAPKREVKFLGEDNPTFRTGEKVRVTGGDYQGVEGYIKRIDRNKRVLVCITGVAVVMLSYIHPKYLEPIEAPSQEQKQENTI